MQRIFAATSPSPAPSGVQGAYIRAYQIQSGFHLDLIRIHLSICPTSHSFVRMIALQHCSCSTLSRVRVELETTKTCCLKAETDHDEALL